MPDGAAAAAHPVARPAARPWRTACRAGPPRPARRRRGRSGWSRARAPSPALRGSSSARKACRSATSFGSNSQSAAPPDLNQTSGASGASRGQLAAPPWRGSRRALIPPSSPSRPSAKPAAHLVMSPAPRKMIMSPGAASPAQLPGDVVRRPPRHAAPRMAALLQPLDQGLVARRPRSAPRPPDRPARPARCRHR